MGTRFKLLFLAFVVTSVACSGGKFSGKADSGNADAATSIEGSEGSINTSDGKVATTSGTIANCDTGSVGITQATLLSNGISTQLGTQTLRYELSVLNCKDGSVQSLKDQPILFDLDATLTTGFKPAPYTVLSTTGASITSATLQVVEGSDLFGNTGNFAHWTTKNLNYSSQLEKLILEIKLENAQVLPRAESDTSINSFLRVGTAKAVTARLPIKN